MPITETQIFVALIIALVFPGIWALRLSLELYK